MVYGQKRRSFWRCLFESYFYWRVVRRVRFLQSVGVVFCRPAEMGVFIVKYVFLRFFGEFESIWASGGLLVILRGEGEDFFSYPIHLFLKMNIGKVDLYYI